MEAQKSEKSWGAYIIWVFAFGYFASYVPYSALTKALTSGSLGGTQLDTFQILPGSVMASLVGMVVFISAMRWWRFAHHFQVGSLTLPRPTKWTFLSGLCSGLIIVTTTLSYTIEGVSIVFAMLLMRGGVLIMSPVVDRITGRHVRWFSWAGLALAIMALFVAFAEPVRPGTSRFAVNVLLLVDVGVYLTAYFIRLQFMSRLGKSDDPRVTKGYFVEEQMVAAPSVLLLMGLLALVLGGGDSGPFYLLREGFVSIWSTPIWGWVVLVGLFSYGTGLFGTLVLLDRSETAFAVPVNRSSSVLAGVCASLLLYFILDLKLPSNYQFAAAGVILVAILFLSIPTLIKKKP